MSYGLGQTKPNEQMGTNILKSWGSPHHGGCWFYTRPIHPSLLWRNKNIWGRVVSYKIIFCLKYLMVTRNCSLSLLNCVFKFFCCKFNIHMFSLWEEKHTKYLFHVVEFWIIYCFTCTAKNQLLQPSGLGPSHDFHLWWLWEFNCS